MKKEIKVLKILNLLMSNMGGYYTTPQICDKVKCDRKTVYRAMDYLECSGFNVEIVKKCRNENAYRFNNLIHNGYTEE